MRQFSAKIWYIWIDVTNVHLPCRTMSTQLRMLGILLVNGAATLASPIFTMGNSSISKSSSWPIIAAAELSTCDARRVYNSALYWMCEVMLRPNNTKTKLDDSHRIFWCHCSFLLLGFGFFRRHEFLEYLELCPLHTLNIKLISRLELVIEIV